MDHQGAPASGGPAWTGCWEAPIASLVALQAPAPLLTQRPPGVPAALVAAPAMHRQQLPGLSQAVYLELPAFSPTLVPADLAAG